MADFYLKQGDTRPVIRYTLQDSTGAAVNLLGATVRFYMTAWGGVPKVNTIANIDDATNGVVSYIWSSADTDTAGTYQAEWRVVFSDLSEETFPNSGYLTVQVLDDLA